MQAHLRRDQVLHCIDSWEEVNEQLRPFIVLGALGTLALSPHTNRESMETPFRQTLAAILGDIPDVLHDRRGAMDL